MKDNKEFILTEEIKRFADHLTYEIKSHKKRLEARQEYIDHIEDAIYYYSLKGTHIKKFSVHCGEKGHHQKVYK